jgi:hypothetical protein
LPRYMAVHTLPFSEEEFVKRVPEMASKIPIGFSWKVTYCDFADNKFFCEWVAPSKAALEEGFKEQKLPFDAIYEVRKYDVANADLEP